MWMLYPVILIHSKFSKKVYRSLEFCCTQNESSLVKTFISLYPLFMPLIFFPCVTTLALISSTLLIGSGENGQLCRVDDA